MSWSELVSTAAGSPDFRGKPRLSRNPLYDALLRFTTSVLVGTGASNSLMRFGICLYPWTRNRYCFSATSSPDPTQRSR